VTGICELLFSHLTHLVAGWKNFWRYERDGSNPRNA
jgi:hypothetical protein